VRSPSLQLDKRDSSHALYVLFLLIAIGCSGCASYSYSFSAVEGAIANNKPAEALEILDKIHDEKESVLYNLNKAILLRMQGDFTASNEAFELSKKLIETYEAVSISEQAGSFIVNDTTRTYIGENYEQVLLHLYASLNYLELGDPDAARVEALQVDLRLNQLAQEKTQGFYIEDAFVRYFSGILYEELGEWSNAMIAYRKAYKTYLKQQAQYAVPLPESLKLALLRLAEREGIRDELKQFQKEFKIKDWPTVSDKLHQGEFVYVLNSGLAPLKREKAIQALSPHSTTQWIRISTPYYQVRDDDVARVRIQASNKNSELQLHTEADLVENIDAIALETLANQMPAITARAVARAAVKYNITHQTQHQNEALGLFMNLVTAFTERADTRSWLTLPKTIFLARISLEPGDYDIQVELFNAHNALIETYQYPGIAIKTQKNIYISKHRISNLSLNRGGT